MSQNEEEDIFNGGNNEDLQFDESAFKIFSSCFLFIIFCYKLFKLIKLKIQDRKIKESFKPKCNCKDCLQKYDDFQFALNKQRKYKQKFFIIILFAIGFIYTIWSTLNKSSFKSFDPFEILKVDSNASDQQIKQSFWNLAKIHHPDKNRNDPNAHKNFILISKAFSCLKDQKAWDKCLYNQANKDSEIDYEYQVGIAMPGFILDKKNQYVVLAIFFFFLIFVLPFVVYNLYQKWDEQNEYGIDRNINIICMMAFKNEHLTFQQFIFMFIQTVDFKEFFFVKEEQIKALQELKKK